MTNLATFIASTAGRDPAECWPWPHARHRNGYGTLTVGGRSTRAHRAVYEQMVGPIPAGLQLDHLCRNRACCNPAHLEPVTAAQNVRRGWAARAGEDRLVAHRVTHGTIYAYVKHRCRCEPCRDAMSAYRLRRRSQPTERAA